jgi:hypothetical protein
MAGAIAALAKKASGVFFTPQRLAPALLSRARNHIAEPWKDQQSLPFKLSNDGDILARRFLIIDVDPVKPKEFKAHSATDAEKEAAAELVANVRSYLARMGWPAPLVVDSGNGFHLYYRLEHALPGGVVADSLADPVAALLRCLKAKFDTPHAGIDPVTFNPSRIMKVPGTPAKKGEPTADRPHRTSAVLEVPSDWRSPVNPRPGAGDIIRRTIDDLDPDGTIRTHATKKGESLASPAVSLCPSNLPPLDRRISRARKHLAKVPGAIQGQNGSKPTLYAARVLVRGYLLDSGTALGLLLSDYNPRCDPPWSVRELEHKIHDAETKPFHKEPGWCLVEKSPAAPAVAAEPVGHPSAPAPEQPYLNEAEDDPHRLARAVLAGYQSNGRRTLVYWRGNFHEWQGAGYRTCSESDFRAHMKAVVHREVEKVQVLRQKQHDPSTGAEPPKMPKVTKQVVENVLVQDQVA